MILGVIPVLCLLAIIGIQSHFSGHRRCAVLKGAVIWGLFIVAETEILSLLNALHKEAVLISWIVFLVLLVGGLLSLHRGRLHALWIGPDPGSRWIALLVAFILAMTFLVSIGSAPNNWDSMTYHLSRVEHWVSQQSLRHYPTAIERQLHSPPFAEMVILQFRLLSGGDEFANLPQWLAMVGSLIGVSSITRRLGGTPRQQAFSTLIAASIPMGILQSSSTQNDYVVTFFLVCLADRLLCQAAPTWKLGQAPWFGAMLGLAALSKGTAYILAAPFTVAFAILLLRRHRLRGLGFGLLALALMIAVNAGIWARNLEVFGTPLVASGTVATAFGPIEFASNLSRNLAVNLVVPGYWRSTGLLASGVSLLHQAFGMSINNPAITLGNTVFSMKPWAQFHEDVAGNLLHLYLLLASGAAFVFYRKDERRFSLSFYWALWLMAVVLFVVLLKWQPWTTRLQLPGFVLGAPLIAMAFGANPAGLSRLWPVVFFVAALPWLFLNQSRPLLAGSAQILGFPASANIWERTYVEGLFANRPNLRDAYMNAAQWLLARNSRRIGIATKGDSWEYPLWALLRGRTGTSPRLTHVCLPAGSISASIKPFAPEPPGVLVVIERPLSPQFMCGSSLFEKRADFRPLGLYERVPLHRPPEPR